jgi:hypothetical protein
MGIKNACIVVDLRTDQDVIHIPDLVAVLSNDSGGQVSSTALLELQEGEEIAVEGEKTKRGVIRASRVWFSR